MAQYEGLPTMQSSPEPGSSTTTVREEYLLVAPQRKDVSRPGTQINGSDI